MKLLQHFIDPYTGQTLPTTKTNICQKQFRLLDIEVERAKDHGFIEVKLYVRHLLPLANLGNCISIQSDTVGTMEAKTTTSFELIILQVDVPQVEYDYELYKNKEG